MADTGLSADPLAEDGESKVWASHSSMRAERDQRHPRVLAHCDIAQSVVDFDVPCHLRGSAMKSAQPRRNDLPGCHAQRMDAQGRFLAQGT